MNDITSMKTGEDSVRCFSSWAGFVLALPGTKRPFLDDWQEKPQPPEVALTWVRDEKPVGFICGEMSSNTYVFDCDGWVNPATDEVEKTFPQFLEAFPDLRNGPIVTRENAPQKGKVLFRMEGPVEGRKFRQKKSGSPYFEILSTGNQALFAGKHETGVDYQLRNGDQPIPTLSTRRFQEIVQIWTGEKLDPAGRTNWGEDKPLYTNQREKGMYQHAYARLETTYFNIVEKCGLVKSDHDPDGWYNGVCPAHQDYNPSFGIKLTPTRIVFNCFTGCSEKEILDSLGLTRADTRLQPVAVDLGKETSRYLLEEETDHSGFVRCVLHLYPDQFLHTNAYGFLFNNGLFWERDLAEARLGQVITEVIERRRELARAGGANYEHIAKASRANNGVIYGIKTVLKNRESELNDIFNTSPDEINVMNGVVNLRQKTLRDRRASDRFLYVNPIPWEPGKGYQRWENYVLSWVGGNKETADRLQIAAGYSLTGHTSEEIMFGIIGPPRSGKGCFTTGIEKAMGAEPLATELDMSVLLDGVKNSAQFDMASLAPCRLVIGHEPPRDVRWNAARLKTLTGGDRINACFKYEMPFVYRPQFKVWVTTNFPFNIDPHDDAAWGRVVMFEFPDSHLDSEDKQLKETIVNSPTMHAEILNWMVEGAYRWYSRQASGGLRPTETMRRLKEEHRQEQDYIFQFLADHTTPAPEGSEQSDGYFVPGEHIYPAYLTFCVTNHTQPFDKKRFTQAMRQLGYQDGRKKLAGKTVRGYCGLKMNQQEDKC